MIEKCLSNMVTLLASQLAGLPFNYLLQQKIGVVAVQAF
jgi:hypothetical protein